jgi:hypothetical protein
MLNKLIPWETLSLKVHQQQQKKVVLLDLWNGISLIMFSVEIIEVPKSVGKFVKTVYLRLNFKNFQPSFYIKKLK